MLSLVLPIWTEQVYFFLLLHTELISIGHFWLCSDSFIKVRTVALVLQTFLNDYFPLPIVEDFLIYHNATKGEKLSQNVLLHIFDTRQ